MLNNTTGNIQYLDLFAGKGQYGNGEPSTPLIVIQKALQSPALCKRLMITFNDANEGYATLLEQAINNIPGIEKLTHKPVVFCSEAEVDAEKILSNMKTIPTFFFADPFGYKGISLQLLKAATKDFGSDCVFFFNYNRVNQHLTASAVEPLMQKIFGDERLNRLQQSCKGLSPGERELVIVEELCNAIRDTIRSTRSQTGSAYVLPFCFKGETGNRTSHHLIFISKDIRGYEIMKEIMAKESSTQEQGVASFEYNVATARQPFLSGFNRPLDELADALCEVFTGRIMTTKEIFDAHHVDTPYIKRNYKDALLSLEASHIITVAPPLGKRKLYKGLPSFGEKVSVTFP